MGYNEGEVLILNLIRELSYYDIDNSDRSNWAVRNRANNGTCIVLRPGVIAPEPVGNKQREITWTTVIEIWQLLQDPGTSAIALRERTQEVIDKIDEHNRLDDTTDSIVDARISGGDEPVEITIRRGESPTWLKQELFCEWKEESTITFANV